MNAIQTRCTFGLACNHGETGRVSWAQDLVIEEHASGERYAEMGTEVTCRIEFALEACYKHLLIRLISDRKSLHLSFTESISEGDLNFTMALSSL